MTSDEMREALIIQAQAINLLMSAVSSLMHGDPLDALVRATLEDAALSFREFSTKLRITEPAEALS